VLEGTICGCTHAKKGKKKKGRTGKDPSVCWKKDTLLKLCGNPPLQFSKDKNRELQLVSHLFPPSQQLHVEKIEGREFSGLQEKHMTTPLYENL